MQKRENYLEELSRIRGEINRLFESALMGAGLEAGGALPPGAWLPPMDVVEDDDLYRFFLELPGVDPASVTCTLQNGVLEIAGERRQRLASGESFRRMERVYGPFRRSIELKGAIEGQPVEATFEQGVLSVTVARQ